MTRRKALEGKLYAGNSHVRFDEGDVAPATPRCGTLLYKTTTARKVAVLVNAALLALASFAVNHYVTYDVTGEETVSEESSANTLNVSGSLTIAKNTTFTVGELNLGGTASSPAVVTVGGTYSKFSATNITIGANGGCGLIRSTGYWSNLELRNILTIHENTPCSPNSAYVDFLAIASYGLASGSGLSNNAAYPARITYSHDSSGNLGWIVTGANWGAYLFRNGSFVLQGGAKTPIWIKAGGGGGSFDPERFPSKLAMDTAHVTMTGTCDVLFSSDSTIRCLQLSNVEFGNTGAVAFTNIGAKVTGPVSFGSGVSVVAVGGVQGYFDLNGNVVTAQTMRVETGSVKSSTGSGTLVFAPGAGGSSRFSGTVDSPATVRKAGAGTLYLDESSMPKLEVAEGTVCVDSPSVSIASLSIAAGATLLVDGCEFALPEQVDCVAGAIVCTNGGSVVTSADSSLFNPDLAQGIVKRGAGKLIIYDPNSLDGLIHAEAGTLAFSRIGLTSPIYRWTFKELTDCPSWSSQPKTLILAKLCLLDANGGWIGTGAMANAADFTAPSDLPAGQIAWQSAITYKESVGSWLKSLKKIFDDGDDRPILVSPLIDPADSSTWISFAFRLPSGANPAVNYNLCTQYHRPRSWVVEASEDGVNWTVVDSRSGVIPGDNTGYIRFFDGETQPTPKFRLSGYVSPGVQNMPAAAAVQVDSGATLDFSSVTGGQSVNEIVIDLSAGCGTLTNAKAASAGTVRLIGVQTGYGAIETPFVTTGIADSENLSAWSVVVDGKVRRGWKVRVQGGTLAVVPPGMVMVVQ